MPAEFENGVFTEGQAAWHGLGVTLPSDALDTQEALQYSGLAGWNLTKQPVFVGNAEDGFTQIPSRFAIVRETDRRALGVVGDWYRIVHNEQAFSWMDSLLGGEGFHYKTAGSLRGGQVVWLLAKAPFDVDLPDSRIESYVLLTNTHDGSGAVTAAITPVRVVCMNTLVAALGSARAAVKIRHTESAESKLSEAQKVLGLARGAAERLRKSAEKLAGTKVSGYEWQQFLERLVPVEADSSKFADTRAQNVRQAIDAIYNGDAFGQREIQGTAWGAYNAVVAYNDHAVSARQSKTSTPAETRFQRIVSGENIGARALALLS